MTNSHAKIWIHAVWTTKNRKPLIHPRMERRLYEFIGVELKRLGCTLSIVNGVPDHVHCLFCMPPDMSVTNIIKHIKGSSSHFINHNDLISDKFVWQNGYGAFTVSQSGVDAVNKYIYFQKKHHEKRSYVAEFEELLALHGLEEG
jgi:putative transposase